METQITQIQAGRYYLTLYGTYVSNDISLNFEFKIKKNLNVDRIFIKIMNDGVLIYGQKYWTMTEKLYFNFPQLRRLAFLIFQKIKIYMYINEVNEESLYFSILENNSFIFILK